MLWWRTGAVAAKPAKPGMKQNNREVRGPLACQRETSVCQSPSDFDRWKNWGLGTGARCLRAKRARVKVPQTQARWPEKGKYQAWGDCDALSPLSHLVH